MLKQQNLIFTSCVAIDVKRNVPGYEVPRCPTLLTDDPLHLVVAALSAEGYLNEMGRHQLLHVTPRQVVGIYGRYIQNKRAVLTVYLNVQWVSS